MKMIPAAVLVMDAWRAQLVETRNRVTVLKQTADFDQYEVTLLIHAPHRLCTAAASVPLLLQPTTLPIRTVSVSRSLPFCRLRLVLVFIVIFIMVFRSAGLGA